MDRIVEVKVNGNYISKDSKNAGAQGEYNMTYLRIEFDEGWDGFAKTITWWNARNQNPVQRTLTADLLEDITQSIRIYKVPIPGEPLEYAGVCTFVIDGYADDKRQSSVQDELVVKPSPRAENADDPIDPNPTQAEQLQVQIDTILGDMQERAIRAENAADNAEQSAQEAAEDAVIAKESEEIATRAAAEAEEAMRGAAASKEAAQEAREAIEGMTVTSETLSGEKDAFVIKQLDDGVVNLHFGIPRGPSGGGGGAVDLDTTLTVEGKAADAKAVGDKFSDLSLAIGEDDKLHIMVSGVAVGEGVDISTAEEEDVSPFAEVNWLDTVYAVGDNGHYRYNAWCPDTVAYDGTRDRIVFMQVHGSSHSDGVKDKTLVLIDPYDPTVYEPVKNFPVLTPGDGVGGLIVENGVWTVYGEKKRSRSSDGGNTWETVSVVTPPDRMYGVFKVDGVLYCGDDYSTTDASHNGWYSVSYDDGLNWEQKVFDFADQYELQCSEARFCSWQGHLYATLRREGSNGLLAKQVDGIWTVVSENLPNVTSDSSMLAFEDLIAISSVDRPNKKLVLSTWDGSSLKVSKEVSFVGLTQSGDFHTPTYICGKDWQAVFFMLYGMCSSEYQSALNAALFGYKDGVNANAPTYETEAVSYSWSDFLTEPYGNATAIEKTGSALNWTPETKGHDVLLNVSKRLPCNYQVDKNGNAVFYSICNQSADQTLKHLPQRGSGVIADVKTIGDRKYICVVELSAEQIGSFDHSVRAKLSVKFMGIATPTVLDYDMAGAEHIGVLYGYGSTSDEAASVYRVADYYEEGEGSTSNLPDVTEADDGKFLRVVNGAWAVADAPGGGGDYVLTDADKQEIAELAAELVPSGGGSAEKEWVKLATIDFSQTENQKYQFDWTDLDDVTEVFVRGSKVENSTATESGISLKVNGVGVSSQFALNKATGKGAYDYGYARFNGLFWDIRSSNGATSATMITHANTNAKYPYNVILDVGKAKTVTILTGGGYNYVPNTGTLEVWAK